MTEIGVGDLVVPTWNRHGERTVLGVVGDYLWLSGNDNDEPPFTAFADEWLPAPAKPKFKVGDKVQNKNHDKLTVDTVIERNGAFLYLVVSKNDLLSLAGENSIELRIEKPPFPRVGAWIHRRDHDDQYHRRITHVDGDCVRYELVNQSGQPTGGAYFALLSSGQVTEVENPFED